MALVTDVSSVLGVVLDHEDAAYAESVIDAVAQEGAVVPCLFWFEIRNALVVNERRGRLTSKTTQIFLDSLGDLPFEAEGLPSDPAVLEMARRHALSVYDGTYLELAYRRQLRLATLDGRLSKVASQAGVTLFETD
jgi:predicted nucleic acid-binding protein